MLAACGNMALWFAGRWSGVELWVMCPVCGMLHSVFVIKEYHTMFNEHA